MWAKFSLRGAHVTEAQSWWVCLRWHHQVQGALSGKPTLCQVQGRKSEGRLQSFLLAPRSYFLNKLRVFIIHHLADRWVLLENIRKCLKSHIYANGMPRLGAGVPGFLICLGQCGKWRRQVAALHNLWSNSWIVKEEGHAERESNFLI